MELADTYDFHSLTNEAETLVIAEIGRQLPLHPEMCTCEECVLDIAACALNKIRPRYRVSLLDTVYADRGERDGYLAEVRRAVSEAIIKVKTNPPHD